jgi:DNA-binding IclR family transcriptional regulator
VGYRLVESDGGARTRVEITLDYSARDIPVGKRLPFTRSARARARLAAAKKVVADFGVTTECGFGWRDPSTINDLLHLDSAVSDMNRAWPSLVSRHSEER